ncbi:MAG: hypothetical protein H6765_08620 [Candidatus Peribacteria bacterium]|nr:MAG: hypothetical protein H6765_08620 [Candidatus Peribacteria bacterium]
MMDKLKSGQSFVGESEGRLFRMLREGSKVTVTQIDRNGFPVANVSAKMFVKRDAEIMIGTVSSKNPNEGTVEYKSTNIPTKQAIEYFESLSVRTQPTGINVRDVMISLKHPVVDPLEREVVNN